MTGRTGWTSGATGRAHGGHHSAAAARGTPSPVHIQGHSANTIPPSGSGPQRHGSGYSNAAIPAGSAVMRQPSDTCSSAADTRPDWPPGSRPRKWSTTEGPVSVDRRSSPGVRGKAALVRPGGRRCRSRRTPPASGHSRGHDSPPHGPARTACSTSRAADGQSADRSGSLQLSFTLPQGRLLAGGRPRRPSSAGTTRPEPGTALALHPEQGGSSTGQATSFSPPEQVHAMTSQGTAAPMPRWGGGLRGRGRGRDDAELLHQR